jgi:signal transduction histidine kinase
MKLSDLIRNHAENLAVLLGESRLLVVVVCDAGGKVLYANRALECLASGLGALEGSRLGDLFRDEDGDPLRPRPTAEAPHGQWISARLFSSDVTVRCSLQQIEQNLLLVGEVIDQGMHGPFKLVTELNNELANLSRELNAKNIALAETQHRVQRILDFIQSGVLMSDAHTGLIRYANPYALKTIGTTFAKVQGLSRDDVFVSGDSPPSLQIQGSTQQEMVLVRNDGNQIPVMVSIGKAGIAEREMVLDCFVDISHLKKGEQERLARRSLEVAMETAGAACHNLNQPLQAVFSLTEMALEDAQPETPLHRDLQDILKNVNRLAEITSQLKNVTSYERIQYSERGYILDLSKASGSKG